MGATEEMFQKVEGNVGRTFHCNAPNVNTFIPSKCGPMERELRTENCRLLAVNQAAGLSPVSQNDFGVAEEVQEAIQAVLSHGSIRIPLSSIPPDKLRMFCLKLEWNIDAYNLRIRVDVREANNSTYLYLRGK